MTVTGAYQCHQDSLESEGGGPACERDGEQNPKHNATATGASSCDQTSLSRRGASIRALAAIAVQQSGWSGRNLRFQAIAYWDKISRTAIYALIMDFVHMRSDHFKNLPLMEPSILICSRIRQRIIKGTVLYLHNFAGSKDATISGDTKAGPSLLQTASRQSYLCTEDKYAIYLYI